MRKSIDPMQDSAKRGTPTVVAAPRTHRLDEFPVGYSSAGCSPVWGHEHMGKTGKELSGIMKRRGTG